MQPWTSWLPSGLEADSAIRTAITEATNQIDSFLRDNPDAQGEDRPEGRRIDFVYPLGVVFRIEADEGTVSVLHIWRFRHRGQ